MIVAAPDPLNIFARPGGTGQTSQLDVINQFGETIDRLDFAFEINTGEPNILVGDPCTAPAAFCGADIAIGSGYSYPITIICPPLMPSQSITRMLTITGTINPEMMGSNSDNVIASVTCTGKASFGVYANNLVFPNTQIGGQSTGTVTVAGSFGGPTVPLVVTMPTDASFTLLTCATPNECTVDNTQTADINIRCEPQAVGSNVGEITITGSNQSTVSQLECNGTTGPTGPDAGAGGGGGGGGGPDAGGGGGGGGGNATGDPASFYACSATAIAGMIPVVIAIGLAMLRGRRRTRR